MKRLILLLVLTGICAPSLWAEETVSVDAYRQIIESRCTSCHEAGRIEQAMAEGRNVNEILDKMIRMGAQLSDREREVLGIYWNAAKQEKK